MITFKNWLPDQPPLGLDGLTEAENVRAENDGSYAHIPSLTSLSMSTLPSVPSAAVMAINAVGVEYVYAGVAGTMYKALSSNDTFVALSGATTFGSFASLQFLQYDESMIFVGGGIAPQISLTLGSTSYTALATAGTAPESNVVGRIGQFVVVGDLHDPSLGTTPSAIQWSAIGDPRSWPTPNSSTALAAQAGTETLESESGPVTAILGGDQFGVVFQRGAVTRMTYTGGTTVFQFDLIDNKVGCVRNGAAIRVGDICYFLSRAGFMRTNGVVVENIGAGAVNEYFIANSDYFNDIKCAYDHARNHVIWSWRRRGDTYTQDLFFYNIISQKFTRARITGGANNPIYRPPGSADAIAGSHQALRAFNQNGLLLEFSGSPMTATITTGETELNEGGYAHVRGVKPLVDVTANAITVAIGSRNDLQASPTYTAEVTANSRSAFCNFRSEARYHRARLTITGTFNSAQGIEIDSFPTSQF